MDGDGSCIRWWRYLMLLDCIFERVLDGDFYVVCILLEWKGGNIGIYGGVIEV